MRIGRKKIRGDILPEGWQVHNRKYDGKNCNHALDAVDWLESENSG
jgi:hypothetical protein